MVPLSSKNQNSTRISWNPDFSLKIWCLFSFLHLHRCVRPFQRLTRKGWPPGISRSWNCSAYSPGKLCWTCLCTDRKGEILQAILPLIFHFQGRCHTWWMFIFLVLVLSFVFFSLSLSLSSPPPEYVKFSSAVEWEVLPLLINSEQFFFCLFALQLDLWVQLPPHSRICEWRCGTAGPKAVSDDSSRAPSWAYGSSEPQWDWGSISTPHTHQSCACSTG